jgi:hypothetical protein
MDDCVWKYGCSPGFYMGRRIRALIGELVAHYNGLRAHKHPLNTMCNVALRIFAFRVIKRESTDGYGEKTSPEPDLA